MACTIMHPIIAAANFSPGIWNEELLPVRWETVQVGLRDAFRIRRIYRKLAKRKGGGPLYRITVFVRYENVTRLLGFLGYRLE